MYEYSAGQVALVRGASQEVAHTASRRSGPRRWLRSVEWLIAAGLHPRANATTLAVARDLGARMDYDTGHVLYRLDETVARTGLSLASVKRHVSYLRQLGALAWVQHGTRSNIRRVFGLGGYAGTATVYAAVIPATYDHALGHRIIGTGYEARVVLDYRQMPDNRTPGTATDPVDNASSGPVDNSAERSCEPPSLTSANQEDQVQMVGGFTTTAERPRNDSTSPKTTKRSSKRATVLGATVTAAGMQLGNKLAKAIRSRVPWARQATHDQLRWVCADMGEQQWTEDQAVRFAVEAGHAHQAGYAWNPDRPHRLLAAELQAAKVRQEQDQQMQEDVAQAVAWEDSTAYREAAARASLAALFAPQPTPEPERTDKDRLRARMDWNVWPEVADHYAEDPDDALDLYGTRLCSYAVGQQARRRTEYAYI
ncbi:hypothetical protein [Streptomyces sp. NPDC056192]|uniref:hypothetical protein n=1 Tax=Streptomyces sp. NPDC056192 TaxID=3345743 RepID=UPI0035D983DD